MCDLILIFKKRETMSKEHTERWCDCFKEYYRHESAIHEILDRKEDELGDGYDDVCEDI